MRALRLPNGNLLIPAEAEMAVARGTDIGAPHEEQHAPPAPGSRDGPGAAWDMGQISLPYPR